MKGLSYLVCYFLFPLLPLLCECQTSSCQSELVEESLLEGIVAWIRIEFCMLKTDCPATLEKNHSRSFPVLESLPFSTAKSSTGGDGTADKIKCVLQLVEGFEIVFLV